MLDMSPGRCVILGATNVVNAFHSSSSLDVDQKGVRSTTLSLFASLYSSVYTMLVSPYKKYHRLLIINKQTIF